MESQYVYRAEYAPSDRSTCKGCSNLIGKDTVRLCILVQSRFHDGKDQLWHHPTCFFKKKPGTNVDEIWHFHDLRWTDQLRIRNLADKSNAQKFSGKNKGKKKERLCYHSDDSDDGELCMDDSKVKKRGQQNGANKKNKKQKTGDDLEQNDRIWTCRDLILSMPKKDQEILLKANDQHVPVASKIPAILADMLVFGPIEKCDVCKSPGGFLVISADAYYCIGHMSEWAKCDVKTQTPTRKPLIIPDDLLEKHGFLGQFAKPSFKKRIFPPCFSLVELNNIQNGAKAVNDHGISNVAVSFSDGKKLTNSVVDGPSTSRGTEEVSVPVPKIKTKFSVKKPLLNLKIAAAGTLAIKRQDMIEIIVNLGGVYVQKGSKDTFVVISDEKTIAARSVLLEMAEVCGVHVVPIEFLDECQSRNLKNQDNLFDLIERIKINPWKTTPLSSRMQVEALKVDFPLSGLSSSEMHRQMELMKNRKYEFKKNETQKVIIKNGGAIDPKCDLDENTHSVYRKGSTVYSCVLTKVNIQGGTNSYYRLQIVKHDQHPKYYLVRSWGRIGRDDVGGTTCDDYGPDEEEAIANFEFHFMDKSGNEWCHRNNFKKKPDKYYLMELDYGTPEPEEERQPAPGSLTKLAKPVQDLLKMIFDVEEMKRTMKEFEIDLRKMPLGNLSRSQITEAMQVLTELQNAIQAGERSESTKFITASNKFFTLVPHDFGMHAPPLINQEAQIKAKLEMLENLLEIEVAFSILKGENRDPNTDPLDQHYAKLKCDMTVLEKTSEDFKTIHKYISNTHASTHSQYKLELHEVFRVERSGESDRFKDFKGLHNHKLLWHGSRTSNYAGILSQGLRIAPPEAPATGYMFGKGIYFADMVSKSANYCYTNDQSANPVGLLLLSDVALGNMKELKAAQTITRLPSDFHSVKGCGRTEPNPSQSITLPDAVEIPLGLPRKALGDHETSLLYNEYVVYKEAQINIRYLVKVGFKYNRNYC